MTFHHRTSNDNIILIARISFLSFVVLATVNSLPNNENKDVISDNGRPNVLLILADDLGWNDVGWNNPDLQTPIMDSLASSGITFTQAYMQPLCSPSRAALLTGYFPFRLGLQHIIIKDNQDVCLPSQLLLPELLQQNGYVTHIVGKWHLGYCKWGCTPTYRGFDSFYGYYNAGEDYYSKVRFGTGFDFRSNENVERGAAGNYSTFQFADKTVEIIRGHDQKKPMFLYLPFQSVHAPLQVPDEYLDMYQNVSSVKRKIISGMVTAMDDAIGQVVDALKETGLYNNTIIIFSSDNGGWTFFGGNNYPLRGGKSTVFEGGTRVPAFIHSPLLAKSGHTYDGMIHAVDWFPTIAEAAGINYTNADQDGVSQWTAINSLGKSARDYFVYNLDLHQYPVSGRAAIRLGEYKLVMGYPGVFQSWYRPEDADQGPNFDIHTSPAIVNYTEHDYNFLFNLADDPEERVNLYSQQPDVVRRLQARLADETRRYVAPNYPDPVAAASPAHFGGVYSPGWC